MAQLLNPTHSCGSAARQTIMQRGGAGQTGAASSHNIAEQQAVSQSVDQIQGSHQTAADRTAPTSVSERLNVNLTKGAADTLDYLVSTTGKSKTEIVRDALFLERYAQEAWHEGGKVIVQRGREKREVIPH